MLVEFKTRIQQVLDTQLHGCCRCDLFGQRYIQAVSRHFINGGEQYITHRKYPGTDNIISRTPAEISGLIIVESSIDNIRGLPLKRTLFLLRYSYLSRSEERRVGTECRTR